MLAPFVTRRVDPDVTVMEFTGQFTLGTTLIEVEYSIKDNIQQGCKKLVLDLAKVSFVDSAGVGMLVVCSSAMEQAGGRLVVSGAAGKVKRTLEVTHLERVIRTYADLTLACGALADPAAAMGQH